MSKHEHCGISFGCQHTNMGYCKHCDTPFCKDCGREWRENSRYYYQSWNGYPTYGGNTSEIVLCAHEDK